MLNKRNKVREPRLYIVPTAWGLLFLSTVVVMILTAATYTNNLIFLLAFFLFALFVISMLQTHDNLRGVEIAGPKRTEGFADEDLEIHFHLTRRERRAAYNIGVRLKSKTIQTVGEDMVQLAGDGAAARARVRARVARRGIFEMPEVIIETRFPHKLFRAWAVRRVGGEIIAYPPARGKKALGAPDWRNGPRAITGVSPSSEGDFGELVPYREGDSSSRIAWKHFARTGRLLRQTHWGAATPHFLIDARGGTEAELEQISRWISLALEQKASFELRGGSRALGVGEGVEFARVCWRHLAGAGIEPE